MSVPAAIASVTFACICQLDQTLDLMQTLDSATTSTIEVACGFHGLLPYSHRYWTEHLLEFLSSSEQVATSFSATVVKSLKHLCQKLMKLSDIGETSNGADKTSILLQKYLSKAEATVIEHIINGEKQSVSHGEQKILMYQSHVLAKPGIRTVACNNEA